MKPEHRDLLNQLRQQPLLRTSLSEPQRRCADWCRKAGLASYSKETKTLSLTGTGLAALKDESGKDSK